MFRGIRRPPFLGPERFGYDVASVPVQLTGDHGTDCFYHDHPYAARFTRWREARAADPYLAARPTTAAQYRAHAALQEDISEDYARRQKPAMNWYELAVAADRRAMEYLRCARRLETLGCGGHYE